MTTPPKSNAPVPRAEEAAALVISVLGYGTTLFFYFRALIRPESHIEFIYQHALAIGCVEFLSLAGAGALFSRWMQKRSGGSTQDYTAVLVIIVIFALAVSMGTGSWVPTFFLIASLAAKFFFVRSYCRKEIDTTMAIGFAALTVAMFGSMLVYKPLEWFLPFPPEVLAARPPKESGDSLEPQTVLSWGIFYFLTTVILQIRVFWRGPFKLKSAEADDGSRA